MKIRTFRWILATVGVFHLYYILEVEDKILSALFSTGESVVYDVPSWGGYIQLAVFPFILISWVILKPHIYLNMSKKAYMLFVPGLIVMLVLPFFSYFSRTEVTAAAITEHNFLGQVTEIHRIEDANSAEASMSIYVSGGMRSLPKLYTNFEYSLTFDDDFEYTLSLVEENDEWWDVVTEIDKTVQLKGIVKNIKGKEYCEILYDSDDIHCYLGHTDQLYDIMDT